MKKLKIGILTSLIILLTCAITILPIIKNIKFGLDLKGGFEILYLVENLNGQKASNEEIKSTYKAINNRIDTLGVSEPEIIIEGNKIRVKMAGVKDEEEARTRLSTPAVLTFRNSTDEELMNSSVLSTPGASIDYDTETSSSLVKLNIKDTDTFYKVTKSISESEDKLITIWLDFEEGDSYKTSKCGTQNTKCISAATVNEAFTNNVVIKGNFTEEEAKELVDLINSGSLPTKLTEISSKTVDASFGKDTLKTVAIAGIITLIIIFSVMIFTYRISGLISSITLILYTVLVFLIFNLIDGILTLTGIAALILGIGMAVDSSIITIEKIKEELKTEKNLEKAYNNSNKKSFISLIDANTTTLIAAIILFIFGESSVKGFATMLIITIIVTFLTMILINRFILKMIIKSKYFNNKNNILLGKIKEQKEKNYLKLSKINIIVILIIISTGIILTFTKGPNLGIDYKGGSSITLTSEEKINKEKTDKLLKNYTKIEEKKEEKLIYYQIEETLNDSEIKTLKTELEKDNITSEITTISNIVKKDLTINSIKSLIMASIGILIYIGIRFTSRFAISSIIAILSDVLITISIFIILNIEINFIFIAGILTIIGYSINDTIIVFDIIREKLKQLKEKNKEILTSVVKESVKMSLKRNVLTSITTLLAIIILLIMNIEGIKEFSLCVLIGLTFGTFSSLFIAPFIWLKLEINSLKHPKEPEEDEPEEKLIKGINY